MPRSGENFNACHTSPGEVDFFKSILSMRLTPQGEVPRVSHTHSCMTKTDHCKPTERVCSVNLPRHLIPSKRTTYTTPHTHKKKATSTRVYDICVDARFLLIPGDLFIYVSFIPRVEDFIFCIPKIYIYMCVSSGTCFSKKPY